MNNADTVILVNVAKISNSKRHKMQITRDFQNGFDFQSNINVLLIGASVTGLRTNQHVLSHTRSHTHMSKTSSICQIDSLAPLTRVP